VLALENATPTDILVELSLCRARPQIPNPIDALIEVDDASPVEVQLDASQPTNGREIRIGTGAHTIRIEASAVPSGQTLGIRVSEAGSPIQPERERAYHVVNPTSPLVMEIVGPARIRIDRLKDGITRTTYESLPDGVTRLELTALGQPEMLYRVTRAVRRAADSTSPRPSVPSATPPHATVPVASVLVDPPAPKPLVPEITRTGLEDGTWSLTARYVSRDNADDEPTPTETEQLGELRGTHRFLNESWGLYSRSDLFARPRQDGGPLFGARGQWTWPSLGIWRGLEAKATLLSLIQPPTDGPNRLEAQFGGRLAAALPHSITAKLRHRPALSIFARWLSLGDANGYPRENIDRDLFTPYKADHRYGLGLTDALSYRPYRDWLTGVQFGVHSNEDFNLFSPDRTSLGASVATLFEGLQVKTGYRWRHYFNDNDRRNSIDRHDLSFDLRLERWIRGGRRWEIGINALHEFTRGTTSLVLSLSLHLGKERGFRDFGPGTVRFRKERDLTRRRMEDVSR